MSLVRTNVHIDDKTLKEIDKIVEPQHLSRAWFIRAAINQAIRNVKAKKGAPLGEKPKR